MRRVGPWTVPALSALVLLLNAGSLRAFFVGDDFEILEKVRRLDDLGDALRMTYVGNWGPLSYVQFYLNHRIAGLDPLVYHVTNLCWLALLVVAVHGFVRTAWPEEPLAAWGAALLFLTHPANDQAVANICGRSHVIATAMAVVALWLYARMRLCDPPRAHRALLLGGALLAGFLAGLSKESAMTLGAWIAAFEWLFVRRAEDSFVRRTLRVGGSAALFALAAVAVIVAGDLVVGHSSPKLAGDSPNAGVFRTVDLAAYGLISGLPFPFAWVDLPALERLQALGWLAIGAAVAAGAWCFAAHLSGRWRSSRAPALYVLGLVIAATTLTPVVYADLQLQRRYVFIANVGTALMAVAAIHGLGTRFPRASRIALGILLLLGAVGTVQRNELYRRSGNVAKNLIETALERPIEDLPLAAGGAGRRVALVTFPRYYGGDRASGAMLLHLTDLRAALRLFGSAQPEVNYALKCYHAGDYATRAEFTSESTVDLHVTFRTDRAFRAAFADDPAEDRLGDAAAAERISADPQARTLRYRLTLAPGFREKYGALLLYGDGKFTRLR